MHFGVYKATLRRDPEPKSIIINWQSINQTLRKPSSLSLTNC